MKINFGKGLLRLYLLIYVFWLLIGLGYFYKALAPHVGINYWTEESYISRIKEGCNEEMPPSSNCIISNDEFLLVPAELGILDESEIKENSKAFFYLFIVMPILLLVTISFVYKGLRWVIKGLK
jgi:hypothetical protein